MDDEQIRRSAATVLERCRARGLTLATAESCTGGMVAAALTDIAGSSDVVERGFVTIPTKPSRRCSASRRPVSPPTAR